MPAKNDQKQQGGSGFFAVVVLVAVVAAALQAVHGHDLPTGAAAAEASPASKVPAVAGVVSARGWVRPVDAEVWGGFRSHNPYNPQHDGVDLGAARYTPIRAASAGVVVTVLCNITPRSYGCDRDGSAQTPGCGWYVDIRHAGNVYTRYCHMVRHPSVHVGQTVAAGQVIGYVGDSGHSGHAHLHFEVHLGDQSRATAVDPIPFMAAHDAPLGTG